VITLQERVHGQPTPIGWQTDKLHRVLRVRRSMKNTGMKEDNLLSLSYGRIIQKDIHTADGLLPENFEGYQIVEPGNIVLRLTDLQNDKRSLRQGLVTQRGIITSAYDSVEVHRDNDARFWFYSLLALDLSKHYYSLGGGVRQSVKFADFPNDWIYRPDLSTQREIADFLDRETARIDLLIEKKQKLVALLGEKFEATAGTLSTGELCTEDKYESGIDWLGSVPKSWRVEKLSWHFFAAKGKDAQKYTKEYCGANEGEFPVYSGQTANEGVMGRINTYDYDFSESGVLFATTVGAKAMDLRLLQGKFSLSQNCMIIIPRKHFPLRFFLYQMRVLFRKERQLIPDHMQASFRVEDLYRYHIAVPPMKHASEIGMQIGKAETALKATVQPINASIDRLKEYRSALITAAVTGQIDVTTYAKSGATDRRLDAIQEEMGA
jgi:type I restriction enzyme, S subunit